MDDSNAIAMQVLDLQEQLERVGVQEPAGLRELREGLQRLAVLQEGDAVVRVDCE